MYAGMYYGQVGYAQTPIFGASSNQITDALIVLASVLVMAVLSSERAFEIVGQLSYADVLSSVSGIDLLDSDSSVTPLSGQSDRAELLGSENISIMQTESDESYVG